MPSTERHAHHLRQSNTQSQLDTTASALTDTAGSFPAGGRDNSSLDGDEDLFVFPATDDAAVIANESAGAEEQRLRDKFNARLAHCMMLGDQAAEAEVKAAKDAKKNENYSKRDRLKYY